jgi:hypothetical protein
MRRAQHIAALLLFGLILLATANSVAEGDTDPFPVTLKQTHTPTGPIPIGSTFSLTFVVEHPQGTHVILPPSMETRRIDLISQSVTESKPEKGPQTTTIRANLGVYRTGIASLPRLAFRVTDLSDRVVTKWSVPIEVQAITVLDGGDEAEFRPAFGPRSLMVDDHALLWMFCVIFFLGVCAAFWVWRGKRGGDGENDAPVIVPHEVAIEKLDQIRAGTLLEDGEYMPYYVELSETVREYLGRRYRMPGTELTTTELEDRLSTLSGDTSLIPYGDRYAKMDLEGPGALDKIRSFLRHCDHAKFSGQSTDLDQAQTALTEAYDVVSITRPRETYEVEEETHVPETGPDAEGMEEQGNATLQAGDADADNMSVNSEMDQGERHSTLPTSDHATAPNKSDTPATDTATSDPAEGSDLPVLPAASETDPPTSGESLSDEIPPQTSSEPQKEVL